MRDKRNFSEKSKDSEKPKGYFPVLENDFLKGVEVVKVDLTDFINNQHQLRRIANELFEDLFDSEISFASDGLYLYIRKTDYVIFQEFFLKHYKDYAQSLKKIYLDTSGESSS